MSMIEGVWTHCTERNLFTWPNALTLSRAFAAAWLATMALGELLWAGTLIAWWGVAFWVVLLGGLTDFLDGQIAKRFPGQRSEFGARFDELTDKVFILACWLCLFVAGAYGWQEVLPVSVMIIRECVVTMRRRGPQGNRYPSNWTGKFKTTFQISAAVACFWEPQLTGSLETLANQLLWLATISSLASYVQMELAARGGLHSGKSPSE